MRWLSDRRSTGYAQPLTRLTSAAHGYELVDKLGEGGMGRSLSALRDTALGRQVALKVIGIVDSSGEFAARLLREARSSRSLSILELSRCTMWARCLMAASFTP